MAGRRRKAISKRHPGGQIVRERGESPAQIAAQMPHRRSLGALAIDQRAESELGRMALTGAIEDHHLLAGSIFAREHGQYLATIGPPRALGGSGRVFDCGGCLGLVGTEKCTCALRKANYEASARSLRSAGRLATEMVKWTALLNRPCVPLLLAHLILGLQALAMHYRLTTQGKQRYENAGSRVPSARP